MDREYTAMSGPKVKDAAMLDAVLGYCALYNLEVNSLSPLSFGEVAKALATMCHDHPEWVWASYEVRQYYPICHSECHISRIQAFVQGGGVWSDSTGPNEKPAPDNVMQFPTSSTKH